MYNLNTLEITNLLLIPIPALLLTYSYFLYPLLLKIVSPRKEDQEQSPEETDSLLTKSSVTVIFTFVSEDFDVLVKRVENILECANPFTLLQVVGIGDGPDTACLTEQLSSYSWNVNVETKNNELQGQLHFHSLTKREGKTAAQNYAVTIATGDMIVFTDANSRFDRLAIGEIVRPLLLKKSPPQKNRSVYEGDCLSREDERIFKIGITVGMLLYEGAGTESQYWTMENRLKALESSICSTIGANGALYAMRKDDYICLPPHTLSDLAQPLLQLLIHKMPSIFIQSAKVYEETPHQYKSTYLRKKRITARALKSLPLLLPLLNPLVWLEHVGGHQTRNTNTLWAPFFFLSHKVIRWATSLLLLSIGTGIFLIFNSAGLLTEGVIGMTLILSSLKIIIHYKVDLPLIRTAAYMYLTLKAQLWAYYATITGVDTSVWEPLQDTSSKED